MEDEPILSEAALEAHSRFIVPFATRRFRQRVFFPTPLLNVLPSLVHSIVGLHAGSQSIPQVIETLSDLKTKALKSPRFIESLDEIADRLQSGIDLPKYVWEFAADLVGFYGELLAFFDSSLKLLSRTDELVQRELSVSLPRLIDAVGRGRPEGARDVTQVSLMLGSPEVMKKFEQYARSQSQLLRKCPVCEEAATWFALPCSHALYCDECKRLDEEVGEIPTECPNCGGAITRLVRVPLPE
jgi:hypothetical protein